MKKKKVEYVDLINLSLDWQQFSCQPDTKKVREDFISDEDKSVKWNKEQVVLINKAHEEEVKSLNRIKNEKLGLFEDACYRYIMQESGVTLEKAKKIYGYLYNKYHSSGTSEVIAELNDLIALFSDKK